MANRADVFLLIRRWYWAGIRPFVREGGEKYKKKVIKQINSMS